VRRTALNGRLVCDVVFAGDTRKSSPSSPVLLITAPTNLETITRRRARGKIFGKENPMLVSKLRNLLLTAALLISWCHLAFSQSSTSPVLNRAGPGIPDENSDKPSMNSFAAISKESSRWSFSIESIYAFENIESPWFVATLHPHKKNPLDYKFVTEILSARYRLTETAGPLFLRGNFEFGVGPIVSAIVNGPESYFVGAAGGFRYNFVQPRARLIPYLELRGGIGKSDSRKIYESLQSDATLTYLLGAGLRYKISSRWSVAVGAMDQHLSTGFFAKHDYGADALGFNVAIELRH
jgi:lipid A 3-O-deacylase